MFGERVALSLPEFQLAHPVELLGYAGLGLVCGVAAVVLKSALRRGAVLTEGLDLSPAYRAGGAGLFVGVLGVIGATEGSSSAWVAKVLPDASFDEVADCFSAHRVPEVFVVDAQGRHHGVIKLQDPHTLLRDPQPDLHARDLGVDVATVRPELSLADRLSVFFRGDVDELPVVDEEALLLGIVRERDAMAAYQREVLQRDDVLAKITYGPENERRTDFFDLPPGMVLHSIDITGQPVGLTLRELKLPARYGCTVVSLMTPSSQRYRGIAADPDLPLDVGMVLVVLGPEEEVARLEAEDMDHEVTVEVTRI